MISRLGCCSTRHKPGSSFSFSAAILNRAACDSQGFFSCSRVSEDSIKTLQNGGACWPKWLCALARREHNWSDGQTLRVYAGGEKRARETRERQWGLRGSAN